MTRITGVLCPYAVVIYRVMRHTPSTNIRLFDKVPEDKNTTFIFFCLLVLFYHFFFFILSCCLPALIYFFSSCPVSPHDYANLRSEWENCICMKRNPPAAQCVECSRRLLLCHTPTKTFFRVIEN